MRILYVSAFMLAGVVSAAAQQSPKPGDQKPTEPVRVPTIKCTQVCDRPVGSPNLGDKATWTNTCEMKCEPEVKR
jgi:hypothetical protein